ncbi:Vomeronasal 2, receptor 16 [Apodemus speciosus]|uniref:Vomeronasal 2, receptor 16 n=1 Tax=Apodemus speciosus TaxID=105296 RepID=A0ABQ0FW02_APOSI
MTCFPEIKNYEDNDGDLRSDCGFLLGTLQGPIEEDFIRIILILGVFLC